METNKKTLIKVPILDLQKKYDGRAFNMQITNSGDAPVRVRLFGNGQTFAEVVDEEEQGGAKQGVVRAATTMPDLSQGLPEGCQVNDVTQYIGETTQSYANGFFYRLVDNGESMPISVRYAWMATSNNSLKRQILKFDETNFDSMFSPNNGGLVNGDIFLWCGTDKYEVPAIRLHVLHEPEGNILRKNYFYELHPSITPNADRLGQINGSDTFKVIKTIDDLTNWALMYFNIEYPIPFIWMGEDTDTSEQSFSIALSDPKLRKGGLYYINQSSGIPNSTYLGMPIRVVDMLPTASAETVGKIFVIITKSLGPAGDVLEANLNFYIGYVSDIMPGVFPPTYGFTKMNERRLNPINSNDFFREPMINKGWQLVSWHEVVNKTGKAKCDTYFTLLINTDCYSGDSYIMSNKHDYIYTECYDVSGPVRAIDAPHRYKLNLTIQGKNKVVDDYSFTLGSYDSGDFYSYFGQQVTYNNVTYNVLVSNKMASSCVLYIPITATNGDSINYFVGPAGYMPNELVVMVPPTPIEVCSPATNTIQCSNLESLGYNGYCMEMENLKTGTRFGFDYRNIQFSKDNGSTWEYVFLGGNLLESNSVEPSGSVIVDGNDIEYIVFKNSISDGTFYNVQKIDKVHIGAGYKNLTINAYNIFNIDVDNNVKNLNIETSDPTGSNSDLLQNIKVLSGDYKDNQDQPQTVTIDRNRNYVTTVGLTSLGQVQTKNLMD